MTECGGDPDSDTKDDIDLQWNAKPKRERLTARIVEEKGGPAVERRQCNGSDRPRRSQLFTKRVLVFEHAKNVTPRVLVARDDDECRT
jgi:hypothetical protein